MLAPVQTQERINFSADERWLLTERIARSAGFRKSPRLSQMLSYLAEQAIAGSPMLVTEQRIAAEVFGRDASFDSAADTIVRSHMVRLRQKLEQYFVENQEEPFRVLVPKGGYVLRFERASGGISTVFQEQPEAVSRLPGKRTGRVAAVPAGLGVLVVLLLSALLYVSARRQPERDPATSVQQPHPFWSLLFQPHKNTTFIAADSGLVLWHGITGGDISLAEYLRRDFERGTQHLSPEKAAAALEIGNRRYTSIVDLETAHRLDLLSQSMPVRLSVKFGRDARVSDFKEGNIILSGSHDADPWLELFEPRMNFVGVHERASGRFVFLNREPKPGESANYSALDKDQGSHVLGVIALLPNLDRTGNVLIMEGSSLAGTEATEDFLFDDTVLLPWLSSIRPSDGVIPHFELLLESNSVNGNAGSFHILAWRIHP